MHENKRESGRDRKAAGNTNQSYPGNDLIETLPLTRGYNIARRLVVTDGGGIIGRQRADFSFNNCRLLLGRATQGESRVHCP